MELARTNDKIHTRDCRYARLTWTWAEPRNREMIIATVLPNGLTECKVCEPLNGELTAARQARR